MESVVVSQLLPGAVDQPALAACSYFHDFGKSPGRYCLRADPVHLQADTHGLVMLDCAHLQLGLEESRALADVLSGHLEEDGWLLQVGDSCRWYLLGDDQDLQSRPACEVTGRHTTLSALQGADARRWTCRLNELQMLLGGSDINQQRMKRRQKVVNSLCIWGGGRTGQAVVSPFDYLVTSNNAVVQGAAASAGVRHLSCEHALQLLEQTGKDVNILVMLEACRYATLAGDSSGWIQALRELEEQWFKPLLDAWHRRTVDSLELYPLNGSRYRLEPSLRWQFWRRPADYRKAPGLLRRSIQ